MSDNITKDSLQEKPLEQWSEEEKQAAEEMGHTVQFSYLNARRLADLGGKTQTWDDVLGSLLDEVTDSEVVA